MQTDCASCLAAGGLSSAEAVVKWLEVHPYLHAADDTATTPHGLSHRHETVDAQEELDRLRPLIDPMCTKEAGLQQR